MDRVSPRNDHIRVAVRVTGIVQGVGFRPFVYRLAVQERLGGFVRNDARGVYIEVQGPPGSVESFLERISREPPPAASVFCVESELIETVGGAAGVAGVDPGIDTPVADGEVAEEGERTEGAAFLIMKSGGKEQRPLPISPDLATCRNCLRDIFTAGDRRHRYPFTNCTDCGPRFTIVNSVPYDRPNTTMSGFIMCSSCAEEYDDPGDRRFHAQPNACAECGPQVELFDPCGERLQGDSVLERACELLAQGKILAVKGMGGYHLACDGESEPAVSRLRRLKHRYDRPFAVMVRDTETAGRLCFINKAERTLLESAAAPIVLLVRRNEKPGSLSRPPIGNEAEKPAADSRETQSYAAGERQSYGAEEDHPTSAMHVADSVAPGLARLGVMLPYTPLHHLLLRGGPRVLVMTSGNVSEEPIAYRDEEAVERLGKLADAFLIHSRPIRSRCDDSVAWVPDGDRAQMIRRSRGYAPAPLPLPVSAPIPTLAVGGHFKNTFCLAEGDSAYLSHHIGDTSNAEALSSFEEGVEHLKTVFSLEPEAVAHDMHPEYITTKYALALGAPDTIPVQHHHAHVASCMAENGVPSGARVLGVAFDGTGYGPDGTIWGGEFLICTYTGFKRYAHLQYMPLPGGEAAVLEPWRLAAFAAERVLGEDFHRKALPLRTLVDVDKWRVIRKAVQRNVNSPLCCSAGRLFDCVSALLGVRGAVNYEGQAAVELEAIALARHASRRNSGSVGWEDVGNLKALDPYPVSIRSHAIGWEPIASAVIEDVLRGVPIDLISAKFHRTVAEAILEVSRGARRDEGVDAVALTGGVFMNEILHCLASRILRAEGFKVYTHSAVPANDGGIAFGQAVVAAAKLAGV